MFKKGPHLVVKSKAAKNTFKSQSAITQLVEQLASLLPKLKLLLGADIFSECDMEQVRKICARLPKSVERNKCVANELQIVKQLGIIFDSFQRQKELEYKFYYPYLLWKHFQDILLTRLKAGTRVKYFNQLKNDQETRQLYLFVQAVQDTTVALEKWATKVKKTSQSSHHQTIGLGYLKEAYRGDDKAIRFTCDSTALASCKISKYDRTSNFQSKHENNCNFDETQNNQKENPSFMMFRASTAKMERKELKMNVRCPSAAQLLKNQPYKKSSFQFRNSMVKSKHRSIDFTPQLATNNNNINWNNKQNKKERKKSKIELCSYFNNEGSLLEGQETQNQQNELNVSILSMDYNRQNKIDPQGNHNTSGDKLSLNQIAWNSPEQQIRNSKAIMNSRLSYIQANDLEDIPQFEIIRGPSKRKTNLISSQGSNSKSRQSQDSSQSIDSDSSKSSSGLDIKAQELELKLKQKRRILKKGRRSGKYITTANDSYKYHPRSSFSKVKNNTYINPNRSRRRIALLTTTQRIIDDEDKGNMDPHPSKTLQFDENVLLASSDPKKMRRVRHIKSAKHVDGPQSGAFNILFAEMNSFLAQDTFTHQKQTGSVFFRQQEKLQEKEDAGIKERLKSMMNDKRNTHSNIFEMNYKISINKDIIYNQIHRRETFDCDKEWIRSIHSGSNLLCQTNM